MISRYNIVLMGKTGAGKSTLGNYLFGSDKFKTGVGKPVTSNGFHSIEFDLRGLPVKVFDSWGIEADKASQWLSELNNELNKRSTGADPVEWFHSVFYCIQAGGHRIENFELEIIRKFVKENYKVTVIFTKSDNATEKELDDLKKVLSDEFGEKVGNVEVCSEDKTRRDGSLAMAFGKKELVDNIHFNFWNSISLRLPERCISVMQNELKRWRETEINKIKKEAGYFNGSELSSKLKNDSKIFFEDIIKGFLVVDEVNKTLKMYSLFTSKISTLSVNNNDVTFLDKIIFEGRSWWSYLPINLIPLAIWGRENTEKELLKNIDIIYKEIDSNIIKMLPNIKNMISGLKP